EARDAADDRGATRGARGRRGSRRTGVHLGGCPRGGARVPGEARATLERPLVGENERVSPRRGRPFLQIPGPTNVPDRVLRAMDRPVIDHRGPEFASLVKSILPDLKRVFRTTEGAVIVYPSSGTGAWEAALVNTLSPGDRVLAFDVGHFSALFSRAARNLGMVVDDVPGRWGSAIPPAEVEARLRADRDRRIRAVLVVHNETSTGARSDIAAIRRAMEAAGHDALLIVDTVSSLGSMDLRFDDWRVDVALTGSQKGLMLPPGLGLLCVGPRALAAGERPTSARSPSSKSQRRSSGPRWPWPSAASRSSLAAASRRWSSRSPRSRFRRDEPDPRRHIYSPVRRVRRAAAKSRRRTGCKRARSRRRAGDEFDRGPGRPHHRLAARLAAPRRRS